MGSETGSSKTTTTSEPPGFIQPYMQYGAEQARGMYERGPQQYYPGQTVVPFAPQTEQAMGMTEQRAINGSPVNRAAQGYATSTLNTPVTSQFGGASNPHLDAMFDQAAMKTRSALDTQFARSGRDLGAQEAVRADQLGNLATNIYGGAYESERNRMLQDLSTQNQQRIALAGMAPGLAAQDYADINALQGVGSQVEDLAGRYMQDNAQRWDFQQNAPQMNLDTYLQRITGAYPGQSSTTATPIHRNRTAGAAGGALAGAASGAAVGSAVPVIGTAIGAIGGGLIGAAGGYYS